MDYETASPWLARQGDRVHANRTCRDPLVTVYMSNCEFVVEIAGGVNRGFLMEYNVEVTMGEPCRKSPSILEAHGGASVTNLRRAYLL